MKKVPKYWWDLAKNNEVIVESDSDKFPVVARFKYDSNGGHRVYGEESSMIKKLGGNPNNVGCATEAIEKAEEYIKDLEAGRRTPASC